MELRNLSDFPCALHSSNQSNVTFNAWSSAQVLIKRQWIQTSWIQKLQMSLNSVNGWFYQLTELWRQQYFNGLSFHHNEPCHSHGHFLSQYIKSVVNDWNLLSYSTDPHPTTTEISKSWHQSAIQKKEQVCVGGKPSILSAVCLCDLVFCHSVLGRSMSLSSDFGGCFCSWCCWWEWVEGKKRAQDKRGMESKVSPSTKQDNLIQECLQCDGHYWHGVICSHAFNPQIITSQAWREWVKYSF